MEYDIIIIGGGHAGLEAVNILNLLKINSLLITPDKNKIAFPSCNPAIGGIGKSHLVYELDALGGIMPVITDKTTLHSKLLNSSKGPAVWSLRSQIDIYEYTSLTYKYISNMDYANILNDICIDIKIENNTIAGIICKNSGFIKCKALILTPGTFLAGKIFIGNEIIEGGRFNEDSSKSLSESLKKYNIKLGRMKTGTSPRVYANSIDFSKMQKQFSEENTGTFSVINKEKKHNSICYITKTNTRTHNIIYENIKYSALYSGNIKGIGPKYCPSIEDKIIKFKNRESHTIFVEPLSKDNEIYYLNGVSTSLPIDKQYEFIHSINGLENAKFAQPGYAIEYDYIKSGQIDHTLENRSINNLFFAGQINGTSGYEEAAVQGFVAGLNAALKLLQKESFVFNRYNSYIGVLIDDLIKKNIEEPYRLFTSRSENRLILRQDNAFIRMKELTDLNLYDFPQKHIYNNYWDKYNKIKSWVFDENKTLKKQYNDFNNPAKSFNEFFELFDINEKLPVLAVYSEIKYKGYLKRFLYLTKKINQMKHKPLPSKDILLNSNFISKETKSIIQKNNFKKIEDLMGIIDPADIENIIIFLLKKH